MSIVRAKFHAATRKVYTAAHRIGFIANKYAKAGGRLDRALNKALDFASQTERLEFLSGHYHALGEKASKFVVPDPGVTQLHQSLRYSTAYPLDLGLKIRKLDMEIAVQRGKTIDLLAGIQPLREIGLQPGKIESGTPLRVARG
jgi:hypothetical protein